MLSDIDKGARWLARPDKQEKSRHIAGLTIWPEKKANHNSAADIVQFVTCGAIYNTLLKKNRENEPRTLEPG